MNVFFKSIAAITLGLLAVSCGSDNDEDVMQPMSLSDGSVKMCLRGDTQSISISGGSGNFTVAVNGNSVTAACDGRIIRLTPEAFGDATLTVTDASTGATAQCTVNVGKSFAEFRPSYTIDPFFGEQSILYMDCDLQSSPRQWVITTLNGHKLHEGTFTTTYMRDETVTNQGEDYNFALFTLEMNEGSTTHHYIAGDMMTIADGTPWWAILFPGTGWHALNQTALDKALTRSTMPTTIIGISFFGTDADLLNPLVSWRAIDPVPLP